MTGNTGVIGIGIDIERLKAQSEARLEPKTLTGHDHFFIVPKHLYKPNKDPLDTCVIDVASWFDSKGNEVDYLLEFPSFPGEPRY